MIGFEKLNPLNSFEWDGDFKEFDCENNIDLSILNKKLEEQILFDKYISKNLSKFCKEFNSRMKKYNLYFVHIIIKE